MLPKTIRRGGHNPIAKLHDLASNGLHNKSDDECVDIFDRCKGAFEYVIERLQEVHDQDAAYQELMKVLSAKKTGNKTYTRCSKERKTIFARIPSGTPLTQSRKPRTLPKFLPSFTRPKPLARSV
jgi:hypothetical protein